MFVKGEGNLARHCIELCQAVGCSSDDTKPKESSLGFGSINMTTATAEERRLLTALDAMTTLSSDDTSACRISFRTSQVTNYYGGMRPFARQARALPNTVVSKVRLIVTRNPVGRKWPMESQGSYTSLHFLRFDLAFSAHRVIRHTGANFTSAPSVNSSKDPHQGLQIVSRPTVQTLSLLILSCAWQKVETRKVSGVCPQSDVVLCRAPELEILVTSQSLNFSTEPPYEAPSDR